MQQLGIRVGDITLVAADAIVNAANTSLLGGGGVDGAIHRAAGPGLLRACQQLPLNSAGERCPTGECRMTPGFRLAARFVIHTVGPVWQGGARGEAQALHDCHRNALNLAAQHGLRSVAFPAISCGIFAYPLEQAAQVAITALQAGLEVHSSLEVTLVAYSQAVAEAWNAVLAE